LSDPWPVLLAGLIVGVGLIVPVNLGVFQGLQSFAAFGILLGLSGVLRLAAGIVLVSIGAGLLGALGASVVSSALILAGSLALLASRLRNSGAARTKAPPLPAGRLRSVVPVAAGMLLFSILTNLDMILVKHFFGPEEAGRYAGAAILGRALLYLPTAIAMALYPMVAEAETLQGDSRVILRRGLRLTAFLTAAALVPYVLFPDLLLRILLGPAFVSAAPLVRLFGLAMAPFTLVFVLLNFQLARRRAAFLVPFVLACLVEFGLITLFFHQRMEHVLMVVAGVGAVLLSWALVGTAAGDRPEFSERLGADEGV
ncbi:MAG: oligosaccharide flippase family protein, partial [Nitrospirae bacterium]|nr:oligosaccharide flippase family protein [Nitrospirota bacterium]